MEFILKDNWIDLTNRPFAKKIYYRMTGKGPTILFLHGWLHSSLVWLPVMKILAKKYTVIAIDLPGFGKSKLEDENNATLDSLVSLIPVLIHSINSRNTIHAIVADSLSSLAVLNYCSSTLCSIPLLLCGYPGKLSYFIKIVGTIRIIQPTLIILRLLPKLLSAVFIRFGCRFTIQAPNTNIESIIDSVLEADPKAAADYLFWLTRNNLREFNLNIHPLKGMILRGSCDRLADKKASVLLAQHLGIQYIEITGSGHTPMLEKPNIFSDAVDQLLNSCGGTHG